MLYVFLLLYVLAGAGAVLFGRQPELIGSRCSRLAYGVRSSRRLSSFDCSEDHPNIYWCPEDHVYVQNNMFSKFVSHGQTVSIAECVCQAFSPCSSKQQAVGFELWAIDNNEALVITEDSMHQVSCMGPVYTSACTLINTLAAPAVISLHMRV